MQLCHTIKYMILKAMMFLLILKQAYVLKSRLAAAESMAHDVIRDLLGVRLDMSKYAVCCF